MRKSAIFVLLGAASIGCDKHVTPPTGPAAPSPTEMRSSAGAVPVPSNAPSTPPIPKLVPNEGIGPLRLGMTRAEVEALMPLTPAPGDPTHRMRVSGVYSLVFSDEPLPNGTLEHIQYSLSKGGGLYIGGRFVETTFDVKNIVGLLHDCKIGSRRPGGIAVMCGGRTLFTRFPSCETRDAKGVCQEYARDKFGHSLKGYDLSVSVSAKPER